MDKETRMKQAASREEAFCGIPFSRREFSMMAIIAQAALSDADILYSIAPMTRFKTDEEELSALGEKLNEFLDTSR